jgi:hypothetical protein
MVRATSQLVAKSGSPATSALQLSSLQEKGKKPGLKPGSLDQPLELARPWANSQVAPEELADTFDSLFDEVGDRNGINMLSDDFFNLDCFSGGDTSRRDPTEDTPDSNDLALATQTPQDDLKDPINWSEWSTFDEDSALATADWMNLPSELQDNTGDGVKGVNVDFDGIETRQQELFGGALVITRRV